MNSLVRLWLRSCLRAYSMPVLTHKGHGVKLRYTVNEHGLIYCTLEGRGVPPGTQADGV